MANKKELNTNNKKVKQYNSDDIKQLTGLEPVYRLSGMYIGSKDEKGIQHILNEVIDNSVDEHKSGTCTQIKVILHNDGSVSVQDNGRGIPTDKKENGISAATIAVSSLHAGGKFLNSAYSKSGGMNGVGVAVTNGTSEWFEMTIKRDGAIYYQRFEIKKEYDKNHNLLIESVKPAQPVNDLAVIGKCPIKDTGTLIRFKPDCDLFSNKIQDEDGQFHTEYYSFNPKTIYDRLTMTACLNPNLTVIFINQTKQKIIDYDNGLANIEIINDEEHFTWKNLNLIDLMLSIRLTNDSDISSEDYKSLIQQKTLPKSIENPLMFSDSCIIHDSKNLDHTGTADIQIAFQWFSDENTNLTSFVNSIPTPLNGSHVTGFLNGIDNVLKTYVKKSKRIKVTDKKDFEQVSNKDIIDGLSAVITIDINLPIFTGQTKEQLNDKRALVAVQNCVEKQFNELLEKKASFSQALITRILKSKKIRENAERARKEATIEKQLRKPQLPIKLVDCDSNDNSINELFLVEGDSAGGSAKDARNPKFQAIFPLRGKVLNVYNKPLSEIVKNTEIQNLINLLGCGMGNSFDITKLRYGKIIIMTDADEDGKHIQVLLLTFFYSKFPELIKQGHIYVAKPPLFCAKKKNKKNIYFSNLESYQKFLISKDSKGWDFSRFKGLGEMNYDSLKETTMDVATRQLIQIKWDEQYQSQNDNTFELLMDSNKSDELKELIRSYSTSNN